MKTITLSPLKQHIQDWKDCKNCSYGSKCTSHVICKGKFPCDVLFIGEAPGVSEDILGIPFVGPAGKMLERQIAQANEEYNFRIAFTNLVCCLPRDESGTISEPDHDNITECSERLADLIHIADPALIVAVGKLAKDYLTPGYKISIRYNDTNSKGQEVKLLSIIHPAAILRSNPAGQGMLFQRTVVQLENAFFDLKGTSNG